MLLIKPNWSAPSHIHAYSTTRLGGVSKGDFAGLNLGAHVSDCPAHVQENRLLLADNVKAAPEFCWLNQTHSCKLVRLSTSTSTGIDADASWIDTNERTCVVMTADCLPVLVTDISGRFVAAIHAGWRGMCDGIIEKNISHICNTLSIPYEQLLIWLGPCIGPEVFEVGEEVREEFIAKDPKAAAAFIAANGKWLANLHQLAKLRLAAFPGITITEDVSCTYSNAAHFYSYRREGRTGRLATFIWIA